MTKTVMSAIDSASRLAALRHVALLDTSAEEAFDRLTRLAARIFQVPVVLVSLVDEDRQFFKSCVGLPEPWASARETPLSHSFCQHAVNSREPLIIEDARTHPLVSENLAIRDLRVVAYAGIPLITQEGEVLGSFCVIDTKPRSWTNQEIIILTELAASVMTEIELRVARVAADIRTKERENEHQQRLAILESISDAFYALDKDWRFTYVNQQAAILLRRTREELLGRNVWSEFPQAVQSALFRQYHQAVKTGRVVHFETFYPPLDTWFEIHAYPSADGLSVYFSNINERVRAAEERTKLIDTLELERTRFAAIIEQLPLGVICAEAPSGRIIMGNKQVEAILRHPLLQSDSIADYEVWRGWHLDGRPVQPEEWPLARAVRGEATIQEFRYQRGDGSLCVLRARGTPVTDSTGNTVAGVITFDDITEQKRDEETRNMLLMREQRRTQQLQGLTTASLVINSAQSLDEVLQVITEQARHIIGAHQAVTSQTVDQNWAQAINVVSLSDKYATYRTYNATTYGAGIYTVVCQTNHSMRLTQAELEAHPAWRKFGSEAASHPPMRGWLAAPLVSRDGHNLGLIQLSDKYEGEFTEEDEALLVQLAQIASIAIDNTRLIEAERQSRKASQEAVQVRDAFLSIAAHELKTPLTSLYGNAQLLQRRAQRDGSTSERDTRAINVIVEQANRLNRMIVALLDVTRLEKGQLSIERAQIDLAALVAKTIDEMRLTLTRHTIAYALPPEPIYIEGDDLRLQQVFQNLISNAIKYSPLGGTVTVRAERRDNQACVAVIDQGIGIPAEALPQLFHRFYRAENVDQQHISGIGIGLFVVKEIVTLHGGTVEVTSAEGTGSTFTVSFPLTSRG